MFTRPLPEPKSESTVPFKQILFPDVHLGQNPFPALYELEYKAETSEPVVKGRYNRVRKLRTRPPLHEKERFAIDIQNT